MQQGGNPIHLDLDGNRHLLLHFLRRAARPLRDHLHPGIGHIGIGFYRQPLERNNPADKKKNAQSENHQPVV